MNDSINNGKEFNKYKFNEAERFAYEKLPIAIGIQQSDGKALYTLLVSDGFCEQFGRNRNRTTECLSGDFFKYIYPDDIIIIKKLFMKLANNSQDDLNAIYRIKFNDDDKYKFFHVKINKMFMSDGTELIFSTHMALDNYQQNNATDALVDKYNDLREEVDVLRNVEFIKQTFMLNMAHDIRTPMNAVIGFSNFGIEETKNAKILEYFKQIKSSGNYLLSILDEAVNYQTLVDKNVKLDKKPILISELVNKIASIVTPRAKEKGITIIFNLPKKQEVYVVCDEIKAQKIIVNVIGNAIKYTPNGGTVDWDYELIEREGQIFASHIIKDTGLGMSEEFLEKMYEPYTRENNILSNCEGGTGLGLSIVKGYVDAMEGKIRCESKIGEGTTFYMEWPTKLLKEEKFERQLDIKTNNEYYDKLRFKDKRILVCEDNEINIKVISKILEKQYIMVDIAENGEIGIKKAKEIDYDVILMDIRMPFVDGLVATREIRKLNIKTPIIGLTADSDKETIDKALNAGMNMYLTKPIDSNKLFDAISKLIRETDNECN